MTNLPAKTNEPRHGSVTELRRKAKGRVTGPNVKRKVWQERIGALSVTVVMACFGCCWTSAQMANQSLRNDASRVPQAGTTRESARSTIEQSPAHRYFTDVMLVNQDGKQMHLYSDLIKDKVVIISSFFATCQASCLPMNHNLEKLQQVLGEHMDKDVHIISISVDPTVDTPANLKEYAKKLHAKPGWYFLTGDKQNVDFALSKVGQFVEHKEDHASLIVIGNERTGLWKKAFGLAQSGELVRVVESVLNDESSRDK
jgi:protein SCO1/2